MSVKISLRPYPPVSFLRPGRISQNSGWGSRLANAHIGRTAVDTEAENERELTSRKRKRRRKRFRQRRSFVGRWRCRWCLRSVPAVSPGSQNQILPPASKIPTKGAISAPSEGGWREYVQASCDFEAECTV